MTVGVWAEVNTAQFLVGVNAIYCPKMRRREVDDVQQSRRMTTCTTGKAVADEVFDGADDGESIQS